MTMGIPPYYPPLVHMIAAAPDLTRTRQREAFDRLEREHLERVRRAEWLSRLWSAIGIVTFFAALGLAAFGAWELLK